MFRRRLLMLGLVVVGVGALGLAALGGATLASHNFPDVPTGVFYHDDVDWLSDNNVTTGYSDGTFKPSNSVTRGEMAAFLHRLAGNLVVAGVHVARDQSGNLKIDRSFNNYNGAVPTLDEVKGTFYLNMGFDASQSYVLCTVDTAVDATRNASCATGTPRIFGIPTIQVDIWDPDSGFTAAEFNLLVFGPVAQLPIPVP